MKTFEEKYFKKLLGIIKKEFKTDSRFLLKLFREDDWSFVIKAHSLVEAAITDLLTSKVNDERLKSIFRRLDMSNSETGKIVFLKLLDLLTPEERQFIRKLSELRNSLVHNVENLSFSFNKYVSEMDKQQKKAWQSLFVKNLKKEETLVAERLALEQPKAAIMLSLFTLMYSIKLLTTRIKEEQRVMKLSSSHSYVFKKDILSKNTLVP